MSKEDNKEIVGRWFEGFLGQPLESQYRRSIGGARYPSEIFAARAATRQRGCKGIYDRIPHGISGPKVRGVADSIAEADYVVGRWEGGGTHTGPAFDDFPIGSLPLGSGSKMHFAGTKGGPRKNREETRWTGSRTVCIAGRD